MRELKIIYGGLACLSMLFAACNTKTTQPEATSFTKADSVTEKYLELQDSMLNAWNQMISDDNQKIRMMHDLLHALMGYEDSDKEELTTMEHRLNQIATSELTQENIDDVEFVDEYDFTVNSLITEMISLTESHRAYSKDSTLQKLAEAIKLNDQEVEANRHNYDRVVAEYNHFLEQNKKYIKEIDSDISLEKKPLFQLTTEE